MIKYMATTYTKIKTGETLDECDFYDCLLTKCCYYCAADWIWRNNLTLVEKTGQLWKEYFKLNPPPCPPPTCADPECPSGRELAYLNVIESITLGGMSSQFIELTLNSATFIDNESPVPPMPDYIVDWGDGSPTESITIGNMLSHAPAMNGVRVGRITWQDAVMEFWYSFGFGIVTASMINRITDVNYNLDCSLYPDYPIDVSDSGEISNFGFTALSGSVFGNSIYLVGGSGTTYSESGQLLTDYNGVSDTIIVSCSVGGGEGPIGTFTNTGVLRTQCIS